VYSEIYGTSAVICGLVLTMRYQTIPRQKLSVAQPTPVKGKARDQLNFVDVDGGDILKCLCK
jgi:hypothetical protein